MEFGGSVGVSTKSPQHNLLNGTLFCEFVNVHLEKKGRHYRLNKRPLSQTNIRRWFAWSREGTHPSFFGADEFLIPVGLHVDDFFYFCQKRGKSPWLKGEAPAWHEHRWTEEDSDWFEWRDPEAAVA
jgi:hypothetical protein